MKNTEGPLIGQCYICLNCKVCFSTVETVLQHGGLSGRGTAPPVDKKTLILKQQDTSLHPTHLPDLCLFVQFG